MPACYQQTPNSEWRFKAAALPSERHLNVFQSSFAAPSKLLTFVTPAITQLPTRLVSRVPTMACTRQRKADHRHGYNFAFRPVNASLQIARSGLPPFPFLPFLPVSLSDRGRQQQLVTWHKFVFNFFWGCFSVSFDF